MISLVLYLFNICPGRRVDARDQVEKMKCDLTPEMMDNEGARKSMALIPALSEGEEINEKICPA